MENLYDKVFLHLASPLSAILACARRDSAAVRKVGMQGRRTIKKQSAPVRVLQTSHVIAK